MSNETEWVLVPRDATPEMWEAGMNCHSPDDTQGDYLEKAWSAMLAAAPQSPAEAPPSAPVGVERIAAEIRATLGYGATITTRRRWAIELEALAQQPAADSRICRVCDGGPGNDGSCLCGHRKWGQPAAVDDAMVERAAKELRDLHREFGDGADLPEKIALEIAEAVLAAALAAKQGGGTDE